jgi:SAM-dependent methyltransferase
MGNAKRIAKKAILASYQALRGLFGSFRDQTFLDPNVPISRRVGHSNCLQYLTEIGNHKGLRILEVGSRQATGAWDARKRFSNAEYVGFDFYPGPSVDVVGDAHKLSQYFGGQKFDIIYSILAFEHFAMPWIVASEMAKLLKVGGIIFVETHFSYSSHQRPWHFFQFSDMALRVLFSPALGIECLEAGASNPIVARFSSLADEELRFMAVRGLYCHSEFLGRKTRDVTHFDWSSVHLDEVVGDTRYPPPERET